MTLERITRSGDDASVGHGSALGLGYPPIGALIETHEQLCSVTVGLPKMATSNPKTLMATSKMQRRLWSSAWVMGQELS